ncbi:cytochrome-c peroxidase [Photobacterium japonica]|uniref:cytochrome-c peroxidase n=1 Tax=Photobacterium japonica TaxID=2910235 RepID=UPI003D09C93F
MSDKAELGRYLFNDVRLSRDGNRSCALCHAPDLGWTNRFSRTPDIHGQATALNTPALLNVADYDVFMQATPGLSSLAATIAVPLFSHAPEEMGMTPNLLQQRLNESNTLYAPLFDAAFGGEPETASELKAKKLFTAKNTIDALVAYVSTIRSIDTAYHRFIAGDKSALSVEQQRGLALFQSDRLACSQCHSGPLLNTPADMPFTMGNRYVNTGLYSEAAYLHTAVAFPLATGVQAVTGKRSDNGKFRIPSLVNVANTGPWGHDGSVAQLRHVIDNYAAGGRVMRVGPKQGDGRAHPAKDNRIQGFTLTPQEKTELLAFLQALSVPSMENMPQHITPFCQLIPLKNKQDPNPCIPAFVYSK